jgi:hypothetical protein
MLLQLIETKCNHHVPHPDRKTMADAPSRRRQPGCISCPPKRFFDLVNDVAPGNSDVMQVALRPLRQFAPVTRAVSPNVEGFDEFVENPRTMMIYHRLM